MPKDQIAIAVVEADEFYSEAIARLIREDQGFSLVGVEPDFFRFMGSGKVSEIDVAIVDPNARGYEEFLRSLDTLDQSPKVLVFASSLQIEVLRRSLRSGADGFLLKPNNPGPRLLSAAKHILSYRSIVLDRSLRELIGQQLRPPSSQNGEESLVTLREEAVLRLVASGRSDAEIAEELGVAAGTVGSHIRNLRQKLDAANRAQLMVEAIRRGVLA